MSCKLHSSEQTLLRIMFNKNIRLSPRATHQAVCWFLDITFVSRLCFCPGCCSGSPGKLGGVTLIRHDCGSACSSSGFLPRTKNTGKDMRVVFFLLNLCDMTLPCFVQTSHAWYKLMDIVLVCEELQKACLQLNCIQMLFLKCLEKKNTCIHTRIWNSK